MFAMQIYSDRRCAICLDHSCHYSDKPLSGRIHLSVSPYTPDFSSVLRSNESVETEKRKKKMRPDNFMSDFQQHWSECYFKKNFAINGILLNFSAVKQHRTVTKKYIEDNESFSTKWMRECNQYYLKLNKMTSISQLWSIWNALVKFIRWFLPGHMYSQYWVWHQLLSTRYQSGERIMEYRMRVIMQMNGRCNNSCVRTRSN